MFTITHNVVIQKTLCNLCTNCTFILDLHCIAQFTVLNSPCLSQSPFSSSSNHKAIAQLRQLWNGDHSTSDVPQFRSDSFDGAGDWVGFLNQVDEVEDDDGDYVPDTRDDEEASRAIGELTPLEK